MQTGKIGVATENIFPIIKKFLYSEHEIFLRELVSNAIDATTKLKTLASQGEFKGDVSDLKVTVSIDKEKKTVTVSDQGIGMSADEVDRYINQIAFSSAGEFLEKYKNEAHVIIGHFGLGFYSSFMVSKKVEILTRSYRDGEKAVLWSCEGDPSFTLTEAEKESFGTDIVLYLDDENLKYLEEDSLNELLNKYCRFLPVPITFGMEKVWKDGKYVETSRPKIINNTKPLWTRKPVDLTDEDYKSFYRELYPGSYEEPLFHIHLNIDYPFNLTGILFFPRIKTNLEIQRNKIQLYCNQVFVSDSVEGIVPEYMTLLHGVIDSPDIPLNVSRSYLQGDPNVKKLSSHITKKAADRLSEIFSQERENFETKWDDLKVFIEYGSITDEKFWERSQKFSLLKSTDDKYYTLDEYKEKISTAQTDKNGNLIYIYASDKTEQFTAIENARNLGYDVLLMDGQLDTHYINFIEGKLEKSSFIRVDADIAENLVKKEETRENSLQPEDQSDLRMIFTGALPKGDLFYVMFEGLDAEAPPVAITRSEYIRRMKDMSAIGGGQSMYAGMPDSYNFVVNANHPLVQKINDKKSKDLAKKLADLNQSVEKAKAASDEIEAKLKDVKSEDLTDADKEMKEKTHEELHQAEEKKENLLAEFGQKNKIVNQLIDLAMLSGGLLKGEALSRFVKRSVDLIK